MKDPEEAKRQKDQRQRSRDRKNTDVHWGPEGGNMRDCLMGTGSFLLG